MFTGDGGITLDSEPVTTSAESPAREPFTHFFSMTASALDGNLWFALRPDAALVCNVFIPPPFCRIYQSRKHRTPMEFFSNAAVFAPSRVPTGVSPALRQCIFLALASMIKSFRRETLVKSVQ